MWEYKIEVIDQYITYNSDEEYPSLFEKKPSNIKIVQEMLDRAGEEGWELVSVNSEGRAKFRGPLLGIIYDTDNTVFIFKRAKQEEK